MSCAKCSRATSFAFFLVFFLIFIIAFSTPYWTTAERGRKDYNYGLWLKCEEHLNGCKKIGYIESSLKATRGMMCVAFIFYGLSLVAYCFWIRKGREYLKRHGAGAIGMAALNLALIGGIFNIIGSIIFGATYVEDLIDDGDEEDYYLHGSFICATFSGVMQVINTAITLPVMTCCVKRKPPTTERPSTSPLGTALAVITETNDVPVTAAGKPVPGTAPSATTSTEPKTNLGYLPPGDYPPQGQYPLAGMYPAPAAGYPPGTTYPAPAGYPSLVGYPPAPGYPTSFPQVHAAPNQYEPPPAYSETKDEARM